VQCSKAWRNKPNLNALAFENVTYRQVRDALLRLPAIFHSDDFGLLLSMKEVRPPTIVTQDVTMTVGSR
jgi:hypothetical protein